MRSINLNYHFPSYWYSWSEAALYIEIHNSKLASLFFYLVIIKPEYVKDAIIIVFNINVVQRFQYKRRNLL